MKYGFAFTLLSVALSLGALRWGGAAYILWWPAIACAIVAAAYLGIGPRAFGKMPNGQIHPLCLILIGPFLVYVSVVWYVTRIFSRETPYNQLMDRIFIGRRLTASERCPDVQRVVDLTCEFSEPRVIRTQGYTSFPILDAGICDPSDLVQMAKAIADSNETIFIHCAQGHGRTSLFAVALILQIHPKMSLPEALQMVQNARPAARPNSKQLRFLNRLAD